MKYIDVPRRGPRNTDEIQTWKKYVINVLLDDLSLTTEDVKDILGILNDAMKNKAEGAREIIGHRRARFGKSTKGDEI